MSILQILLSRLAEGDQARQAERVETSDGSGSDFFSRKERTARPHDADVDRLKS